jgi:hypothetical protein
MRFREQESAMKRLDLPKTHAPAPPGPQCPAEEVWLEVIAGLHLHRAEIYLSHAIQCDHCGQLLRQPAIDLEDEVSPEEEDTIARLRTSTPEGQRELAAILRAKANLNGGR